MTDVGAVSVPALYGKLLSDKHRGRLIRVMQVGRLDLNVLQGPDDSSQSGGALGLRDQCDANVPTHRLRRQIASLMTADGSM